MRFLCIVWLIAIHLCACAVAAERGVDSFDVELPFGVEIGPDGRLYVTEIKTHRVVRFDLKTRAMTTVAGNGQCGYSGDGGLATEAAMNEPYEVRFDSRGNMYVVEMKNHVVRRIDAKTQAISTVAGTGSAGYSGDGGPATKAKLNQPHTIALDGDDNLYIADIGNHRIRRVDATTGIIESIAGNGERVLPKDDQPARGKPILGPRALFIQDETLWIALREGQSVWRMDLGDGILHHVAGTGQSGYTGDGGPAVDATFKGPKGIAVGPNGAVFVVDSDNNVVRQIDPKSGLIETGRIAPLNQPHGICVAPNGDVFVGDSLNNRVWRFDSNP
jgi:DNA-binding beta-propeller fold protein YncE